MQGARLDVARDGTSEGSQAGGSYHRSSERCADSSCMASHAVPRARQAAAHLTGPSLSCRRGTSIIKYWVHTAGPRRGGVECVLCDKALHARERGQLPGRPASPPAAHPSSTPAGAAAQSAFPSGAQRAHCKTSLRPERDSRHGFPVAWPVAHPSAASHPCAPIAHPYCMTGCHPAVTQQVSPPCAPQTPCSFPAAGGTRPQGTAPSPPLPPLPAPLHPVLASLQLPGLPQPLPAVLHPEAPAGRQRQQTEGSAAQPAAPLAPHRWLLPLLARRAAAQAPRCRRCLQCCHCCCCCCRPMAAALSACACEAGWRLQGVCSGKEYAFLEEDKDCRGNRKGVTKKRKKNCSAARTLARAFPARQLSRVGSAASALPPAAHHAPETGPQL